MHDIEVRNAPYCFTHMSLLIVAKPADIWLRMSICAPLIVFRSPSILCMRTAEVAASAFRDATSAFRDATSAVRLATPDSNRSTFLINNDAHAGGASGGGGGGCRHGCVYLQGALDRSFWLLDA